MVLDVAAPRAAVVLELAPHRAERIAQCHERILVCRSPGACMANRNYVVGKPYVDVKVIQRSVPMVSRRRSDDHVAMRYARLEFLETCDQ